MEEVKTASQLSEIHKRGEGFLFNDLRPDTSYRYWGTLHKASCQWLTKMNMNVRWSNKHWFPTREEARRWIQRQNDAQGREYRICRKCNP